MNLRFRELISSYDKNKKFLDHFQVNNNELILDNSSYFHYKKFEMEDIFRRAKTILIIWGSGVVTDDLPPFQEKIQTKAPSATLAFENVDMLLQCKPNTLFDFHLVFFFNVVFFSEQIKFIFRFDFVWFDQQ